MAEMRPACFAEKWHDWEIHATPKRGLIIIIIIPFYYFDQYYDYLNSKLDSTHHSLASQFHYFLC